VAAKCCWEALLMVFANKYNHSAQVENKMSGGSEVARSIQTECFEEVTNSADGHDCYESKNTESKAFDQAEPRVQLQRLDSSPDYQSALSRSILFRLYDLQTRYSRAPDSR
jgi:hypothetical protein